MFSNLRKFMAKMYETRNSPCDASAILSGPESSVEANSRLIRLFRVPWNRGGIRLVHRRSLRRAKPKQMKQSFSVLPRGRGCFNVSACWSTCKIYRWGIAEPHQCQNSFTCPGAVSRGNVDGDTLPDASLRRPLPVIAHACTASQELCRRTQPLSPSIPRGPRWNMVFHQPCFC